MKNLNQNNPSWPGLSKIRLFSIFLRRLPITIFLLLLSLSLKPDDFFAVKDSIIEESSFKLAFLYCTPQIMMENFGYTSSIFTYNDKENPDWTGDLGLGLRASTILANRLILQAEDLPHYSFYLENKNLRSWSNRFAATVYSYVGPLNLKARYTQNNLTRRPYLEFSRPFHYTNSEWSGEVDFGRPKNLFLTAHAAFRKMAYGEDQYLGNNNLAESLDQRENVFGLKLNKLIFSNTILYADYELSTYRFDFRSERDTRAQTMALGIEFPEIGILQGSFQIGLMRFEPKNPLFKPSQSLSGRGEVSLTLFERLRLNLSYALGTHFSYMASDLFYHSQSYGGGVEIYLTSFLKAGASYDDGRLKYFSFLDQSLQRSDRLRNQRYSLAIPFFGGMSLGFAYNVYRLSSDALNLNYTRSFWGGFISYGF